MEIQNIDSDTVAAAIEADAGQALPDLRQALMEGKLCIARHLTTHKQILPQQTREKS